MIKAIIFDLDGTLLNTVDDIKNSLNYILKSNNFPEKTSEEVRSFLGYGSLNLIKDSLPKDTSDDIINNVYNEYVNHYTANNNILTGPYDDILTLIKLLKANKYLLAITSNKMQSAVSELNDDTFLGLIDVAIGEREGLKLKPDPEMLYLALNELKLNSDEVIYVGDTEVDLLTAKNANIKSVAVTWGFRTKKELLKHNPNYIIDTPLDLLEVIDAIQN